MEKQNIKILYVENNMRDQMLFEAFVQEEGLPYNYTIARSVSEGRKMLASGQFDVVLLDHDLGDGCSFDLFDDVGTDIPIVIITGNGDEQVAVKAMKNGAADYLTKNIGGDHLTGLPGAIEKAISYKRLEKRLKKVKILFVEDDEKDLMLFEAFLKQENLPYDYVLGRSVAEGKDILRKNSFDIVLLDYLLGDGSAFDLFGDIHPDVPIVIVTGFGNEEAAVQAMKLGATDYLTKDEENSHLRLLPMLIEKAIRQKHSERDLRRYHEQLEAMVEERTNLLEERNRQLRAEIQEREKAEQEKEKLEIRLRQTHKMEAIGTLAGGIAHDLNNILYPIVGYGEMIHEEASEGSMIQRNIMEVLKAANRAKEMVRQILTFSRYSKSERKPLKVQFVIREVLKLLRNMLPTTIDIRENINSACGTVMADPTQLHQVMMNLCTNAYHAMRESGGVLEVSLGETNLGEDEPAFETGISPGPYLKLSVRDTGHGMDNKTMERIFDPYFTTKEPDDGSGMGLSVIHGIVKGHNGDINVYSEPGKGSIFNVYLPLLNTAVKPETVNTTVAPGGKENILLVDDEEQILKMLDRALRLKGYHVTALTDSVEALEAFRKNPDSYDLVLTDQTMPGMTGDQLARKLMDIKPDIPIILCTGFSETFPKEKAKSIGIREYVMKPVSINELGKIIRRIVNGEL